MNINKKSTTYLVFAVLLFALLTFASFYKAKSTAIELVGDTLNYFPLSKSSIAIELFEKKQIVWRFQFSFPNSVDEDIYVYTDLLGNTCRTIPANLGDLLRCFEEQKHHPYSKEGIKSSRQRSSEGKSAEVLCK